MTNKFIQLSRKLIISNEDEAKLYKLDKWYLAYFSEQKYQLESLGRLQGEEIEKKSKGILNTQLEGIFGRRFADELIGNNPFVDLNDNEVELDEIILRARTFNVDGPNILHIYLITKTLKLLETIGNFLIINDQDASQFLSIELSSVTTVHSIK